MARNRDVMEEMGERIEWTHIPYRLGCEGVKKEEEESIF